MNSHRGRLHLAALTLLAVLNAEKLAAQVPTPPLLPSTRVVHAGAASLYPAVSLHDVGTDSNVYNEWVAPKEDFTYTLSPRLYAVVPIGGTRFIGTGVGDFKYFRTYADQRSIDASVSGRYDVVDAAFRPFVSASLGTYRERQGLEIDARVRQTKTTIQLGGEFEITAITSLVGWVKRDDTSWDPDERYMGVSLANQLDLKADFLAAGARFRLTPLTTLTAVAEIQRDRFETSPERDADSLWLAPAFEFDNRAVLTGQARAGFRVFKPLSPALDGYRGPVASIGLQYAFDQMTRVDLAGGRDVKYSYDPLQPFYLETGIRVRLVQRLFGPFEGVLIAERWQLRYQQVGGQSFDGREEDTRTLGGGVAYRLSPEMELTFTVDWTDRVSTEPVGRNYERRRVLASISYGL